MPGGLFDTTMSVLESALDLRAERHRLLASNIANMETPGYRARDIVFENELKRSTGDLTMAKTALVGTNPGHIRTAGHSGGSPAVVYRATDLPGYDHNSVGVEGEMVRLSENSLMYSTAVKMLKSKFETLMTAIKEGGR